MAPKKFKAHFAPSELPPLVPLHSPDAPNALVLYKADGLTDSEWIFYYMMSIHFSKTSENTTEENEL